MPDTGNTNAPPWGSAAEKTGKLADMDKAGGQGNVKGMCRCPGGKRGSCVGQGVGEGPEKAIMPVSSFALLTGYVHWALNKHHSSGDHRQSPCPHGACGLTGWQTPINQSHQQMSNAMVQGVMSVCDLIWSSEHH